MKSGNAGYVAAGTGVPAQQEWFEKNGFNEAGLTYCVFGDDTYAIKDKLKEMGCKYSPILKWHSPIPLDVPVGYGMFGVQFNDILQWDYKTNNAFYLESAKAYIDRKFAEAEGPSLSEYVGQIGDRLRNITAVYKSCRGFAGRYGWTNIYTFTVGDDVLVWFTATSLNIEPGTTVDLTGTVKCHEEFRGVKTTQLSRCKVVKVR